MPEKDRKTTSWAPVIVFVLMAGFIWIVGYFTTNPPTVTRTYSEFVADLEAGRFSEVEMTPTQLIGTFSTETPEGKTHAAATRPPDLDDPRLLDLLTQ